MATLRPATPERGKQDIDVVYVRQHQIGDAIFLAGGEATNPEQLFAAGYSACFLGAMKFVAARDKIAMSKDAFIEGEVGIGPLPTGFGIEAKLNIHLPEMDAAEAKKLVDAAHIVCPYSNATRGNSDITLNILN